MDKLFNWISIIIGIAGGIISYVLGAFDVMLKILLVLMIIDYITGIIKGIYNKKLSSYIGWKGILKKISTLCVVVLANMAQMLLGDNVGIRDIAIVFYIAKYYITVHLNMELHSFVT